MTRGRTRASRAQAGDCDWGFLSDNYWVSAMRGTVRRISTAYGVDCMDLHQELVLWLAVRPEVTSSRPSRKILDAQAIHLAKAIQGPLEARLEEV